MSLILITLLLIISAVIPVTSAPPADKNFSELLEKIEPLVLIELESQGKTDFFVWMVEKADLSPAEALQKKAEKGRFVYERLRETANQSQAALRHVLDSQGVTYKPFYIANKILVEGGTLALLTSLASRTDVAEITANHKYQLEEPFVNVAETNLPRGIETNISFIKAPQVWTMGYAGQGIVLAENSTGLDWNHPALINQYRGWNGSTANHNYNWWDATGTYPEEPNDNHGHGTITSGIMVGDDGGANQIGVAPGAQLIACKSITDGGAGTDSTFTECFQFDLAPWDLSGAYPDPDSAPDVINNSWGYFDGNAPQFKDEIQALRAAGILVEAAVGNEGPGCTMLRSPSDYWEVLSTGSINHTTAFPGSLSGFSSRGPSDLDGNYFPDVTAPGENIRSSVPGGGYESGLSGTSFAGPHTTALVALMWSACPSLKGMVSETINIIQNTASPVTSYVGSCGGDYVTGPNNDWGYGTIDALAAVQQAIRLCGRSCILLVDDDNNDPDVQTYFTEALDTMGMSYDVFDVGGGAGNGPDLNQLMDYSMVFWFSGDKYSDFSAGPNPTDEINLAAYLDAGGNYFLTSQDYLYNMGLTTFGSSYLGIGAYTNDFGDATSIIGLTGDPIGDGLGPFSLSYPLGFVDFGDTINPALDASASFMAIDNGHNLSIDKDGGKWKTVFFSTDWVPVHYNNPINGITILQRIIDWFGACTPPIRTCFLPLVLK
jgi:hypothetical protein